MARNRIDSVIVTLCDELGEEVFDIELPCNVEIRHIRKLLVKTEVVRGGEIICLRTKGNDLPDNKTLAECKVWTGSVLEIIKEAKHGIY